MVDLTVAIGIGQPPQRQTFSGRNQETADSPPRFVAPDAVSHFFGFDQIHLGVWLLGRPCQAFGDQLRIDPSPECPGIPSYQRSSGKKDFS